MRKYKEDKNVKCPFYRRENGTSVYCEGIDGGTTHIIMRDAAALAKHKARFCNRMKYENCPYAKMLGGQYDEQQIR